MPGKQRKAMDEVKAIHSYNINFFILILFSLACKWSESDEKCTPGGHFEKTMQSILSFKKVN